MGRANPPDEPVRARLVEDDSPYLMPMGKPLQDHPSAQKTQQAAVAGGLKFGGPYQVRTGDLLNAIEALYQLS